MARHPIHPHAEIMARLLASGPSALDDGEALQVLSNLSAQDIAALLGEFGSLPEVLGATSAGLRRRVSPEGAARLMLARDVSLRLLRAPLRVRPVLSGWSVVADYLKAALVGRTREEFRVLFLDNRNRLVRDEVVGDGTVDHVPVYPREVLRRALELDASALVLAHNHPGGDPAPSQADIEATRRISDAGRLLRVTVHDHFLVAGERVVSFKTLGVL